MKEKKFSLKTKEKLIRRIKTNNKNSDDKGEKERINLKKSDKKIILERDNYTCRYCKKRDYHFKSSLHIHHIDYNPQNNDLDNLITLCFRCHRNTNLNRDFWKEYFKKLISDNKNIAHKK